MNFKISGLLVALSFFLGNCNYPKLEKEAPEVNEVKINSKFYINLPENHTTGYLWQMSPDFDKTLIENLGPVWHGNEKGIYFNLKPRAVGQTTLNFVLRKYTDTTDVKNFIIKIVDN
jgi:hypothetical protein